MIKTPYTNIDLVSAYLQEEILEDFETYVERWILAVSKSMDDMANRQLVADTYEENEDFEIRYFDVDNYGYLTIDDCVEIQSIEYKNGETWEELGASDYDVYPAIAPYRKIMFGFPIGLQNVRIRAKWGYMEAITDDLQWAATVLVAGICIANQAIGGKNFIQVTREKIGNYEVAYSNGSESAGKVTGFKDLEEAKQIISNYRKILI